MTLERPNSRASADAKQPEITRSRGHIFIVIRLLGGRSGGAERLFVELANMLVGAGYEATAIYCDSSREPPFYPFDPKVTVLNLYGKSSKKAIGYKTLDRLGSRYPKASWLAPANWLSKNLYFIRRLRAAILAADPDAVISFLPPANTPSLIAGYLSGAKVIPTNHNVPELDYRSPKRWDQNPIDRFLRLKSLYSAETVHVLFPTFAEWFPHDIKKKIVVIENYVSPDFDDVRPPKRRRKEIVAVGRLAPVKNYTCLVEAWSRIASAHPEWCVKIYGTGPQRRELSALVAKHGLEDSVQLMGHESNIKEAYVGAAIFCHPALHEGFGLSVAEALACGLPVVAFSDCPGVNEFVHDERNGLMVDRERGPAAIADGLERLIHDRTFRERLQHDAPSSISRFSKDAFLKSWTQVIDDVISGKASA